MADLQELLTAVRDTYQKVSEMYGLIKDHEKDLVVVEKAESLMEDTRTNLLYLNDCIQEYAIVAQHSDQTTDSMHSKASGPPHVSPGVTKSGVAMNFTEKLLEDEMKRQVETTMRHMMTEMIELLERKNSYGSAGHNLGCGMNSTQDTKHSLPVDDSADFDIL